MNAVEYSTYFEGIASNHKELGHVRNTHQAFIPIIQPRVNDPFSQNLWLIEFYRIMQSGVKFPCMLMENYVWDHEDNGADSFTKRCAGAFIILEQAVKDNPDDINRALALTERISDDILSYLKEDFHIQFRNHHFSLNNVACETVGPVEGICWGTRVDFVVTFSNKQNINYDPSKWNTPLADYL